MGPTTSPEPALPQRGSSPPTHSSAAQPARDRTLTPRTGAATRDITLTPKPANRASHPVASASHTQTGARPQMGPRLKGYVSTSLRARIAALRKQNQQLVALHDQTQEIARPATRDLDATVLTARDVATLRDQISVAT